jgi:hypothetical protein
MIDIVYVGQRVVSKTSMKSDLSVNITLLVKAEAAAAAT